MKWKQRNAQNEPKTHSDFHQREISYNEVPVSLVILNSTLFFMADERNILNLNIYITLQQISTDENIYFHRNVNIVFKCKYVNILKM